MIGEILSLCAVPVVLAPKNGGEWRMCTKSRAINMINIKYRFPLPGMDELIGCLSGATYFTKIDLNIGYHHNRIRDDDEWKTASQTKD